MAAGRLRTGPLCDLAADYARRITLPLTVREVDIRARRSGAAGREEIEERFLKAIPDGAGVILMDEGGKSLSSLEFAAHIDSLRAGGEIQDLAFVVGGPDGHGPRLRQKARDKLAFGRATWPHLLARVLLLEQIYRMQTIWAGSPYHKV